MHPSFRLLTAFVCAVLASTDLRAQVAGSLDPTFNPNVDGTVLMTAVQPDGKIVRNGFVPRTGAAIMPALKKLRTEPCPFVNLPEKKPSRWGDALTADKMKECRWLKPTLVCRVAFVEWTEGGKLRHCTFVAMRNNKSARAVVRET